MSIDELFRLFPDNAACLQYIFSQRYEDPVICPKCKRLNAFHYNKRHQNFVCNCGQGVIIPRKNTLFHGSHIPLPKWFLALYFIATEENTITTQHLANRIGISYPSAYQLRKRISSMILAYVGSLITPEDERDILPKLSSKKNNMHVTREMESRYVAEFFFRQKYDGDDAFQKLLDLAIRYHEASTMKGYKYYKNR